MMSIPARQPTAALDGSFHNWELAAHLIYKESSPHKVLCARFYDNNDVAMEDIKRMAELEAVTP
jgi:hypothetical protein